VDDPNAISGSGGGSRRWRAVTFRIAAVLLAVLPFILAEAGLRLFGWGRPEESADALSGFNQRLPLFARQGQVYRTPHAREPFFYPQEFPVTKPGNGFRAFCFGGSTVYGHPYEGETAFPKWLELELAAGDPARPCQVINCGGVSYASYRLAPLVKEVLHYQPDLVILATGHNEFLEDRTYQAIKSRSPAWASIQDAAYSLRLVNLARGWLGKRPERKTQLSPEVEPKLDQASGYASYHRDDAWHQRVIAQFDESVRAMVADCRAAGVPVILVKLGANLRDCSPFKSEHRPGLSADQERAWQEAFEAAGAAEPTDLAHALELYRKAETIDGEYALLAYRIARTLDRLGRKPEALGYYLRAKEQDVCPLRIITPFQEILTRIAAETAAPLVDAAALLAAQAPDSIPGFDCYLDHVHPNIGGHQKIAQALAEQVRRCGLSPKGSTWPEAKRRQAYADHLKQLGPRYFSDGRRRVVWLDHWARRQRLLEETLPRDAQGYTRLGFRCLDLGDEEGAWRALGQAFQQDSGVVGLIRTHAQELEAEGRPESAASLRQRFADAPKPQRAPGGSEGGASGRPVLPEYL
jgi:tetratricopeptide (TPR) repeat protein